MPPITRTFSAIVLACCLPGTGNALEVRILDSNGKPLPGATLSTGDTSHTPPPLPDSAIVDQRDKRFEPHVSVIAPGAAVRFPNSDDTRHHVYSFSPGNTFELKLYRTGDAPPVVFENPGIVTLGCNIHDNMKAYIVVSDDPAIALSNADGIADLGWLPAGKTATLNVWHPQLRETVTFALSDDETADGSATITLPLTWSDPQAVRSTSQLESLLRRYSRDGD